jgi:hypothetical protein
MRSVSAAMLRTSGVGAVCAAALVALCTAPLWRGAVLELPFLEAVRAQPVEAALLVPVLAAAVFGAAYRLELPHLHETSCRRMGPFRVVAVVAVLGLTSLPALAAPEQLRHAIDRNAVMAVAAIVLGGCVLTRGAAWVPLLLAVLFMSIFGARIGGGYDGWAVFFQPDLTTSGAALAVVSGTAALLCVLGDVRAALGRWLR